VKQGSTFKNKMRMNMSGQDCRSTCPHQHTIHTCSLYGWIKKIEKEERSRGGGRNKNRRIWQMKKEERKT
jgi:hypothetical protein